MDDFRFAARIEQDEPRTAFYVRKQGSCQRLKGSGFPGGAVVEGLSVSAGDAGSIPGP